MKILEHKHNRIIFDPEEVKQALINYAKKGKIIFDYKNAEMIIDCDSGICSDKNEKDNAYTFYGVYLDSSTGSMEVGNE